MGIVPLVSIIERTVSGTATVTDWCGELVLEKTGSGARSAKRLMMDGGYVDLATGNTARRHFVRDHLGSVRAVVDDAGTVLETDDYYPLGGPLPTGTSTALQPQKYQGKDWNATASFNVYDFGARLYDPALGRWLSQDPLAEKYQAHSPYLFCAGNPMKFVDPEGTSTYVTRLNDGTYQVFGGNLNDNNLGIYVVEMVDGKYYIEDVPIGYTATMYSFYNSDIGGIDGWRKDAIIDPNDPMGSSFLEEIESGVTLFEYIDKARTGKVWDVKVANNTENVIENIKIYRGMPIDTRDGLPVYASARDVGNIAAGYVAGVHGMSWVAARIGFDVYQSYKSIRTTVEGISTQSAQWYGWKIGHRQWLSEYGKMNEKNYYAF